MRQTSRVLVGLVLIAALGRPPIAVAQPAAPPTIHRVTVQSDTGVLTITAPASGPTCR